MAYSEKVIDHYEHPRNVGTLDKNAQDVGTGMVGAPACGDVMRLQIKVNDEGVIEDAKFKTYGCGSAIASSSLVTEWVKGKTLDEAGAITNAEIADELALPPVKIHCSILAEDAIKAATGQDANRAFRAPGGNFPLEVWQNVESLITAEIGWTIDTTDWQLPGSSAIYEQIVSAGPGDVLLMHDGGGDRQQTVDALREALPALKEKGYRFVTIDELMQYALVDEWTDSSAQAGEGGGADSSEDAGNSDSDTGSESGDNEGNE